MHRLGVDIALEANPPISSTSMPGAGRSTMTGAGAATEAGPAGWSVPSTSVTGRKVGPGDVSGVNSFFQENNNRVPMPYLLATPETDAPSRHVSSTIRLLSAALKLRRLPEPPDRAEGM